MGIWIRSQDKEMIINCYALEIDLGDGKSICSNGYVLGNYSSKEKALKVLDMIENFIISLDKYLIENDNYSGAPSLRKVATNVFQMPQDDEV